jgi:hypothetical protein
MVYTKISTKSPYGYHIRKNLLGGDLHGVKNRWEIRLGDSHILI